MKFSTLVEGRRLRARRALLAATTILAMGAAVPSLAQLAPPAPVRQSIDGNGVDLFLGTMNVDAPALTIGQGDPQGLSYYRSIAAAAGATISSRRWNSTPAVR